jgi:hypothetical protein
MPDDQYADRCGAPAYLEDTSPRNRALHERHGFQVTGELALAGGPPLWAMWREPATRGQHSNLAERVAAALAAEQGASAERAPELRNQAAGAGVFAQRH